MEMIIGGAFQGKAAYGEKMYPHITWAEGKELDESGLMKAEGVRNFQDYIRKELKAGREVSSLAQRLIENNPEVILISCEIGYGVVPVDAFDRVYREAVGRVCTRLAAYSDKVTRVICGTGMVIKNA